MNIKPIFEEKQYMGRNRHWILTRLVLAIFCFIMYANAENRERNADLFLVVGICILVISGLLTFIIHYRTVIYDKYMILDGFWTTSLVKIEFRTLEKAEKVPYSKFIFNNPVYNLHKNGMIRFFTRGDQALKLTDKDGLVYLIGSQHPDELARLISQRIKP